MHRNLTKQQKLFNSALTTNSCIINNNNNIITKNSTLLLPSKLYNPLLRSTVYNLQSYINMSACDNCINPGIASQGQSKGRIEDIAGVRTYKTGSGNKIVIFVTDIFGLEYINNQLLADEIALQSNSTVYLPDLFNTNPIPYQQADNLDMKKLFNEWLPKHSPENASNIVEKVLSSVTTISNDKAILVGYCYGAKPIVLLFKSHPAAAQKLSGIVLNHPTFIQNEDADIINVPVHLNLAEVDHAFQGQVKDYFINTLKNKHLLTIQEHNGVEHGFAVRPKNEEGQKQKDRATHATVEFIKAH